jgi:hypothetical protein
LIEAPASLLDTVLEEINDSLQEWAALLKSLFAAGKYDAVDTVKLYMKKLDSYRAEIQHASVGEVLKLWFHVVVVSAAFPTVFPLLRTNDVICTLPYATRFPRRILL